jgi:3-phenylpropionate/cinnamic acid dioxygenase small subunit
MTTLEQRVQLLEDRAAIIDLVIDYAVAIDDGAWDRYAALFTDPVHIDFSAAGLPAADFPRDQFAAFAAQGLSVWDARQHISPNHRVTVDDCDPDRAVCHSYMYAQHHKQGADLYLMRGAYDHHVVRTPDGWKIAKVVQHISWIEGSDIAGP